MVKIYESCLYIPYSNTKLNATALHYLVSMVYFLWHHKWEILSGIRRADRSTYCKSWQNIGLCMRYVRELRTHGNVVLFKKKNKQKISCPWKNMHSQYIFTWQHYPVSRTLWIGDLLFPWIHHFSFMIS